MIEGMEEEFRDLESKIIADESSPVSQWGKLSYEGVWRKSRFRAMKVYDLSEPFSEGKPKRRVKGIPAHLSSSLPEKAFGQSELDRPIVNSFSLRATASMGIGIFKSSRILGTCLNRKRRCDVNSCGASL